MKMILAVVTAMVPAFVGAQELIVGTFNTESASDTAPYKVAETIREAGFVDVWALQEIENLETLTEFTVAAGSAGGRSSFRRVISESGQNSAQHRKSDHLGIVYNSSRLRQVETVELHGIRSTPGLGRLGEPEWRLRGALFVRLQDKKTSAEFYVGNVHLKCCGGEGVDIRVHQAEIIKQWIERSDVPVILTGDFNIPVELPLASPVTGSAAFATLTSKMDWLQPTNPIKTQCSDDFNSMLDHFFIIEGANLTAIDVTIQNTEASFCDDEKKGGADHRPVIGRFQLQ